MYLMAAVSAYGNGGSKSKKKHGGCSRRRGPAPQECGSGGRSSKVGAGGGGATAAFELLEIDENDNSFPWGMIHHNELAHMLNNGLDKTMVIDSRSFLEYNTSSVHQAINVCCSKLVKRRLQQDKVHVLDLLNQACNLGADSSWDVIVYDQCTEDPSHLTSDNFVQVLLHKLSTTFNSVAFLKGGFLAFQASHPSLIENKSGSHRCSTLTSLSQPCMPVSNIGPTRILPFLYLGSQQDALNQEVAQVNGITYILNVSKTCPRPNFILESHFHRIPVNDNYCEKLLPFFNEAFQFLDKVREANGCVLVHCLGGISRSATLAIAYIMKYMKMSSDEAYRYVKDKRPTISPNFNFLGQLLEYERIIRKEVEQMEEARRVRATQSEDGCETERASPGSMDLHTSSPSSPGPRTARQLASTSLAFRLNLSQDCGLASDITYQLPSWEARSVAGVATTKTLTTDMEIAPALFPGLHRDSCDRQYTGVSDKIFPACISAIVSNNCDKNGSQQDVRFPVCPLTGFPSPGSGTESTCTVSGFPGPEPYGSKDMMSLGVPLPPDKTTYQSSSNTSKHKEPNLCLEMSGKKDPPPKIRHGLSFSSIFSNFRWRSRPPTLPLGSPVGQAKDAGRYLKNQGGESGSSGDPRVQLTPVSEAVENTDLTVVEETGDDVTKDCKPPSDYCSSVQTNSGSSPASTVASCVVIHDFSASETTTSTTRPSPVLPGSSSALRLSARHFTLALSSPTSDFPVTFTPVPQHKLLSPAAGDSNKRKSGLAASDEDSPDKLAKTEACHQSAVTPPRTLNISQCDKSKQRARRAFVLPLSSPTTAMARLNFASPTEPTCTVIDNAGSFSGAGSSHMEIDKPSNSPLLTLNCMPSKVECSRSDAALAKIDRHVVEMSESIDTMATIHCLPSTVASSAQLRTSSMSSPSNLSSLSSSSVSLQDFQELPTTSLDKLSFTPCYTKDIVQELRARDVTMAAREEGEARSSALDSPMSISSSSSAPSSTLSPVDPNMANPFPDCVPRSCDEIQFSLTTKALTCLPTTECPLIGGVPRGTPDSPNSEFFLSPSMPQATMAPTFSTLSSPVYYSSSSSLEPMSPMSITDSASGSPKWLSKRNSLCSPSTGSVILCSPMISSPSLSPLVTSPMSSSSQLASTSSSVSSASVTRVVRRDKSKRVIDRPYSIAFSSYPTCDLVANSPGIGAMPGSPAGHSSQDDASEAYMSVSGKRSRLSAPCMSSTNLGRTSWAGYSEREVYNKYKEITAAMENAMMRTQAITSSKASSGRGDQARKARSLDDFLDSNAEADEPVTFKSGNQRWRPPHLEPYHCGMHSTGEPYHSSSSLSSNGSHGSSLEIIQLPR